VVGCWFGDGATSEGDWHEGLNFAGIHRLPVIFVCENNQYAISVPQSKQMAVKDVASRAEGYGFTGVVVDGNDVLACYGAMKAAHERAKAGEGPTLIECKTYRFMPHTSDDDDKSYRSREEVDQAKARDPLVQFASYLREHDVLDDAGEEALRAEVKQEIDDAIRAAWDAADPDPDTALRHVFQEREEER
jgi:2-oxoisovalerate dehydrogenase E1 component subunit alpha